MSVDLKIPTYITMIWGRSYIQIFMKCQNLDILQILQIANFGVAAATIVANRGMLSD